MLSLSPAKLLIVAIVALVLVGPDKLPQVARQLGAFWRAFRSFSQKVESEVRASVPDLPSSGDIARYARSPITLLDNLAKIDAQPLEDDPGAPSVGTLSQGLRPDPAAPPSKPGSLAGRSEDDADIAFDPRWN